MSAPYEEIEHTADLSLRVRGRDWSDLLIHATEGMLHVAGAQLARDPGERRTIELRAPDQEGLLVAWLEELLFAMEARQAAYSEIDLRLAEKTRLVAEVQEAPLVSLARHVKAVTYHGLHIDSTPAGLEATLTFDI